MEFRSVVCALCLVGCATSAEVDALSKQIEAMEQRIADLEARPAGGQGGLSSADEAKAGDLTRAMIGAYRSGDFEKAKSDWNQMRSKYAASKAYRDRSVQKFGAELGVVGTKVATLPKPEKWYIGDDAALDVSSGTTLVVFWEEW